MKFKDLSTNEKIDAILRHLNDLHTKEREEEHRDNIGFDGRNIYKQEEFEIAEAVNYKSGETYGNEIKLILDYLSETQKYILKEPILDQPITRYRYSILYAGKVFIENGGYSAEATRLADLNQERATTQRRLFQMTKETLKVNLWIMRGTIGAGVIGFLVLVYYWFSFAYDHHWIFPCACKCP